MNGPTVNVAIYDLAEESRASCATVSRALNGRADVGEKTRKRTIEAGKRLDNRPRAIVRGLGTRKSWLVGVAHSGEFDNPFFGTLLSRAKEIFEPAGYEHLFFHSPPGGESFDLVARARYHQIDGPLAAGVGQKSSISQMLQTPDVPIVSIDAHLAMRSSAILATHFRGSTQAMNHQWSLQHRGIRVVAGDLDIASGLYRSGACTEFLRPRGVATRTQWVVNAGFGRGSRDATYRLVRRVAESSERPTAWLCFEDMMAIGAMEACRDVGISVPEEVSIVALTTSRKLESWTLGQRRSVRTPSRLGVRPRESTGPPPMTADQHGGRA